jgi:hypothetical protein
MSVFNRVGLWPPRLHLSGLASRIRFNRVGLWPPRLHLSGLASRIRFNRVGLWPPRCTFRDWRPATTR